MDDLPFIATPEDFQEALEKMHVLRKKSKNKLRRVVVLSKIRKGSDFSKNWW